ncbi:MAG: hypothetical protein ERJ67_06870 [Aphanocapsa feldmannii 277cV]|uniref:Uncharacterized protein n=2 Tax=Aphanocapsa feldmannii TaxID=192050 RepID=A0A524RMN8_9CHRO|nr:MAG: hypothetical protein ERJ67_06870 [Aphanocapsa feldmannii 277cV]TGH20530.1 MAG: hypothetical protein ERJ68_06725 [Aphanocapsa feldmannii 277cI]
MNEIDICRKQMLFWCIHQLQAAAGMAMKQKNPGALVSCIREPDALCGFGINSAGGYRHHYRR